MSQVQIAARIDARIKRAIDEVCESRGLKISRFVEDALLDKLEELEDIEDLQSLRHEPTRKLSELIKDLGLDGEV